MRCPVTALAALVLLAAGLAGCGREPEPSRDVPTPSQQRQAAAVVRLRAVDLNGNPVPGMLPIATESANGLDEHLVARGAPTGTDGCSVFRIPPGRRLYVRAWDDTRRLFASNYHEVFPSSGGQTKLLDVVMVPGASLRAELHSAEGAPIADTNVGLMMFHPTEGPWWPDEGDTDARGVVVFPSVPPGTYLIKLKAATGAMVELPEVDLPPGGATDLGAITLR